MSGGTNLNPASPKFRNLISLYRFCLKPDPRMIFSGVWCHVIRMGACQVLEGIFVRKGGKFFASPVRERERGEKSPGPVPFGLFSAVTIRLPGRG